jgi:hypothetical protein
MRVSPVIGLPLSGLSVWVLGMLLYILYRKRSGRPFRWSRESARGVAIGLTGGSSALIGVAYSQAGIQDQPVWAYFAFWIGGAVVPVFVSYNVFARWARRSYPQEWELIRTRDVDWSRFPSALQRAGVLLMLVVVLSLVGAWVIAFR